MAGSVWTVQDNSYMQQNVSVAGVILCIIFVWFCLLGLLFLLMKDQKLGGYVQITVQGKGFHHQTFVPVYGPDTFMEVNRTVNYARSLSAQA